MQELKCVEIYHIINQLKHYAVALGYTVYINFNNDTEPNLVFVKKNKIQFMAKDMDSVLVIYGVFESMIETENIDYVCTLKTDVIVGDAQEFLDILNSKISEDDF